MRSTDTQLDSYKRTFDENRETKLDKIRRAFQSFGGKAATFQIAEHLGWSFHLVSGKITVLQDKGELRDTGTTIVRSMGKIKRNVAVWELGNFEPRAGNDPMFPATVKACHAKIRELLAQLNWEPVQREVCGQCKGKGYIETQQGKFDV